jgi:dihydroflavonol-4-reductase
LKAFVTGATGFIGANITRELLRQGFEVRVLVRENSNRRNLDGLDVECVVGDVRDGSSLGGKLKGCAALFHAAAAYAFWTPDPKKIYEINVKGTENILNAAKRVGTKRVVYTSTEATIGIKNGSLGTEEGEANLEELPGHYKKSKYLAEKLALRLCAEGLPLVVVNPTAPVGPWDVKPTPTGRFILDFLNRQMPAWIKAGLNIVSVRDVAKGHILAMERGGIGQRYVLGNSSGNFTFREILGLLEKITGLRAPRFGIPYSLAFAAGLVDELVSGKILRKRPRIALSAVKASRKYRHFDCSKAIRELGIPQSSVEEAFTEAANWFHENGYVASSRTGARSKGGVEA